MISKVASWFFVSAALAFFLPSQSADAAGPWKAQVIDAETGKPLDGVVVLAVWHRRYASPGGWAGGGYYDSEEVVTGPDGQFTIQSRWTFTFLPFLTTIKGPEFYIFKPGYGRWKFRGQESWSEDTFRNEEQQKQAWRQFEGEGIVLALPPLKTNEERLRFLSHPGGEIPKEKIAKYLEALDEERINLGLKPGYSK